MEQKLKIAIIGGSSSIAVHCARQWVLKRLVDLTLVGRNAERLERVAADLRTRSPESEIQIVQTDFLNPEAIQATVARIVERGALDIVLIAQGYLPEQKDCQSNLQICRDALEINGVSPILFAEAFAKGMAKVNHGTLALIGSVAGDRGRKSNYVYGAAKGLVDRYTQGLQHRFAGTRVKIKLIKPGPTDTPMTAHLKGTHTKLAPASDVAKQIINDLNTKKPVIYTPKKWHLIMLVIRHLPHSIFNKLNI